MDFFTRTRRPATVCAPCGSTMKAEYERRLDDKGIPRLVKTGEYNFYAHKQSFLAECTVYTLLDRYRESGDDSYIDQQKGRYVDVTSTPRSLAELEQFRIDSERAFYNLPLDIRKLFGNNPQQFIADPGRAQSILDALSNPPKAGSVKTGESQSGEAAS